jgi:hypothetical protein
MISNSERKIGPIFLKGNVHYHDGMIEVLDEMLFEAFPSERNLTISDYGVYLEELNLEEFFKNSKEGIYNVLAECNFIYTSSWTDCGMEHDMDLEILKIETIYLNEKEIV